MFVWVVPVPKRCWNKVNLLFLSFFVTMYNLKQVFMLYVLPSMELSFCGKVYFVDPALLLTQWFYVISATRERTWGCKVIWWRQDLLAEVRSSLTHTAPVHSLLSPWQKSVAAFTHQVKSAAGMPLMKMGPVGRNKTLGKPRFIKHTVFSLYIVLCAFWVIMRIKHFYSAPRSCWNMFHFQHTPCGMNMLNRIDNKCWNNRKKKRNRREKKKSTNTEKMWGDACYSKKYLVYLLWEATSQGSQQSWRFFCLYGVLFGVTICWLLDKGIYTERFWLLDKGIYTERFWLLDKGIYAEHLLIVGQGHLQWTFVDCWTRAFTMQLTVCWLLDKGIYSEHLLIVGQRHWHRHLLIVGQRHLHWTFVHWWTNTFTLNVCWLLDKGIYSEQLLIVRQRHLRWAFVDCWTKAFTLNICPLHYPLPQSSILCEPVVCWDLEFSQACHCSYSSKFHCSLWPAVVRVGTRCSHLLLEW